MFARICELRLAAWEHVEAMHVGPMFLDEPFLGGVKPIEIVRNPHHFVVDVGCSPFAQLLAKLSMKQQ